MAKMDRAARRAKLAAVRKASKEAFSEKGQVEPPEKEVPEQQRPPVEVPKQDEARDKTPEPEQPPAEKEEAPKEEPSEEPADAGFEERADTPKEEPPAPRMPAEEDVEEDVEGETAPGPEDAQEEADPEPEASPEPAEIPDYPEGFTEPMSPGEAPFAEEEEHFSLTIMISLEEGALTSLFDTGYQLRFDGDLKRKRYFTLLDPQDNEVEDLNIGKEDDVRVLSLESGGETLQVQLCSSEGLVMAKLEDGRGVKSPGPAFDARLLMDSGERLFGDLHTDVPEPEAKPAESPDVAEKGIRAPNGEYLPTDKRPKKVRVNCDRPGAETRFGDYNLIYTESSGGGVKSFSLYGPDRKKIGETINLSPNASEVVLDAGSAEAPCKITLEHTGDAVVAYAVGIKSKVGRMFDKDSGPMRFLEKAVHYLPELTLSAGAAIVTYLSTLSASTSAWVSNTLGGAYGWSVGSFAAVTAGLVLWSWIDKYRDRRAYDEANAKR